MPEDNAPFEPPTGVDRRAFVKGAMGAAALGVAGAAGFGIFKQAAIVKPSTVKLVKYLGAKVLVGSPAPRGIPLIPVRVNEEGFVEGVPQDEDENYLDWYRYCSHENAPGLANPEFTKDNIIEYFLTEEKLVKAGAKAAERWWYHDKLEQPIRADDFLRAKGSGIKADGYGAGAAFRWRSAGQAGNNIITGVLLKLHPDDFKGVDRETLERFMDMEHHLIAFSTYCTHFCCVPGFREDPTADQLGFWDMIFCTCHNSRYDPRKLTEYEFELRLETGAEGAGGGGH